MTEFAHTKPEHTERLIVSLVSLGDVLVPGGANDLRALGAALEKINQNRQILTRVQSRILIATKQWAAEVSGRKAEYRIKVDDLCLNDQDVKVASSQEARLARARARSVAEHRGVVEAIKEQALWAALLDVCGNVQENLKIAKESISRLLNIAELEFQASAFGPTPLQRR